MRRIIFVFALPLIALVSLVSAQVAGAAVTVKQQPTASFSGASVTVSGGNFSGLGNTPAFAQVTANGQANYDCLNPSGHFVPGQNPVAAQSGTSPLVQLSSTHNGRSTIPPVTATVTAPPTPTAQQVGCGGGGSTAWTVVLKSLTATAAHLEVTQSGTTVLCRNYALGGSATGIAC
jgi:hypothetical protein